MVPAVLKYLMWRISIRKDFRSGLLVHRFPRLATNTGKYQIRNVDCLPSTLALDPARARLPENEEQPIDLFYAFVYVSDREEGLVGSNVATLVDGNPDNNFLKRDVTFNPDGLLTGATFVTATGHRLYLTTPRGLFVIDCTDPMSPRLVGRFTGNFLRNPHCVAIQFRYAFVADEDGLKVLNVTDPERPVPVSSGWFDCKIRVDST
jgi:hypothetical protein